MKKEEKQKKINEIKSFIEKQKVLERDFSILKYLCSVRTTNVIQNVLCLNIKQIEDLELQVTGELSKLKIEKQKIITELTSSWLEDRRRKGRFLSDPKKYGKTLLTNHFVDQYQVSSIKDIVSFSERSLCFKVRMELRPRYSPHLYIPISSGKEPITKFNIEEWKIISFKGKSPYSAKELVLVEHTATGELVYLTVE